MPDRTPPGRLASEQLSLTSREKLQMVLLYVGIIAVTIVSFAIAFAYLPHETGGEVTHGFLLFTGLGITAYILGLRHGFDADHIAAIDNTTRKLLNEGQRPLTVGTWFSLGHSTIVGGLVVALVVATEYIQSHVAAFAAVGSVVGTLVSGVFLFLIGLINLIIVVEVYRIFRGLRDRQLDEAQLEVQMQRRGFLYRYFGRLFRVVTKPYQIYPIGVLFGLGFDTATEVTLIAISVTVSVSGAIPLWSVLVLPLLFTCGMVLSDTTDGFAMRYAYGWAFLKPIRKIYYNLTLTIISVMVAFVIGGVELLQVLSTELGWGGGFWNWLDNLNFEQLGIGIVLLFLVTWGAAMAIYRIKRYEEIGFGPPPPERPAASS
ncbi:MAG: HoxN/HupN/NixA family nickel/cobalt transporter [Thermoplasmata archaeon]|nr:HoxN/HupN/NixA family nickel/cobalt transporter [Thermoplasmata archaeon]MCI4341150.1 HoxN/HupN/NixA family nickel/cobalt transporter [Thermoplasmata archaeon]